MRLVQTSVAEEEYLLLRQRENQEGKASKQVARKWT